MNNDLDLRKAIEELRIEDRKIDPKYLDPNQYSHKIVLSFTDGATEENLESLKENYLEVAEIIKAPKDKSEMDMIICYLKRGLEHTLAKTRVNRKISSYDEYYQDPYQLVTKAS